MKVFEFGGDAILTLIALLELPGILADHKN